MQSSPTIEAVLAGLSKMEDLKADWDSYGAPAIGKDVLDRAYRLLAELYRLAESSGLKLPAPRLLAGGDASIGFHWTNEAEDSDLEVFVAPGRLEYVSSRRGEVSDASLSSAAEVLDLIQHRILPTRAAANDANGPHAR
jgi:hypothetical protein